LRGRHLRVINERHRRGRGRLHDRLGLGDGFGLGDGLRLGNRFGFHDRFGFDERFGFDDRFGFDHYDGFDDGLGLGFDDRLGFDHYDGFGFDDRLGFGFHDGFGFDERFGFDDGFGLDDGLGLNHRDGLGLNHHDRLGLNHHDRLGFNHRDGLGLKHYDGLGLNHRDGLGLNDGFRLDDRLGHRDVGLAHLRDQHCLGSIDGAGGRQRHGRDGRLGHGNRCLLCRRCFFGGRNRLRNMRVADRLTLRTPAWERRLSVGHRLSLRGLARTTTKRGIRGGLRASSLLRCRCCGLRRRRD